MTITGDSVGGQAREVINPSGGSSPSRPILTFESKTASETRIPILRVLLSNCDRNWTEAKREYDIVSKWGDGSGKNVKKVMDAADYRRKVIRNRIKQLAIHEEERQTIGDDSCRCG